MELYRVTIPKDYAWQVLETLGDMGLAHFIHMNRETGAFLGPYAERISQCDEAERKLLYLIKLCSENRLKLNRPTDAEHFGEKTKQIEQNLGAARHLLFDKVQ